MTKDPNGIIKCPHCGNEDTENIALAELYPVDQGCFRLNEDGVLINQNMGEVCWDAAGDDGQYFTCLACYKTFDIPEGAEWDYD